VAPKTAAKDATDGSNSQEKTTPKKGNPDLDSYEVFYSKHINQKIKTWEEGLFTYNNKNFKASLYIDM